MGGGGSKTTTTTVDPWKNMPGWMKEAYQKDAAFREGMLDEGKAISDEMRENPREILGPSDLETGALDELMRGQSEADRLSGIAEGTLGLEGESGIDPGGYKDRYMSEYTDDVVDTTLAGMDRQAQRDQLARDSRAAAVGGTSNTRAAVGDAVAKNLSGMSMAEMEAKLRDEATRFGTDAGFKEADFREDQFQSGLDFDMGQSDLARDLAGDEVSRSGIVGAGMSGLGELERILGQQGIDTEFSNDKDALSWLGGLFSGTGGSKGPTGRTETSEQPRPSTFSQILGAGTAIGGSILSDERAKEEIVPMDVGLDALKDVTPATYKYKEGMPTDKKGRQAGLMAQDLEHIPGAVTKGDDGLRRVDPYPVLATVVQAVKELDARTSP